MPAGETNSMGYRVLIAASLAVVMALGCRGRSEEGCLALSHLEETLVPDMEAAGYLPTTGPIDNREAYMARLKHLGTSDTEEARRWRDWRNTLDDLGKLCPVSDPPSFDPD